MTQYNIFKFLMMAAGILLMTAPIALVQAQTSVLYDDFQGALYNPSPNPTLFNPNYHPGSSETLFTDTSIFPPGTTQSVGANLNFTSPFAQPIVTTEYRAHIPPHETPLPGLYLANMFQVYPQDRGQNYSIALANKLAKRLLLAR